MSKTLFSLLVFVSLLSLGLATSHAVAGEDAMVENPKYKFWANFKVGATSTYIQATKFHGTEKATLPGGVEKKTIKYRLISVTKNSVVLLTTVVEEDFLGTVESAPTKITFPARVKKANLQALLSEWNAKQGEDEIIKVGGTEITCKVRAGSHKVEGGTVEAKLCFSATVPGGIVSHTRITKDANTVVAETTTTLLSFGELKKKAKE